MPSAVFAPATSRHLPLLVLTIETNPPPASRSVNDCALVPLQSQSWIFVPFAVPLAYTSTHLLACVFTMCTAPPPASSMRKAWAAEPLHHHS